MIQAGSSIFFASRHLHHVKIRNVTHISNRCFLVHKKGLDFTKFNLMYLNSPQKLDDDWTIGHVTYLLTWHVRFRGYICQWVAMRRLLQIDREMGICVSAVERRCLITANRKPAGRPTQRLPTETMQLPTRTIPKNNAMDMQSKRVQQITRDNEYLYMPCLPVGDEKFKDDTARTIINPQQMQTSQHLWQTSIASSEGNTNIVRS